MTRHREWGVFDGDGKGIDEEGVDAELVRLNAVEPKPIDWLWKGRIPLGKVTLIAGDPGLGKSMLSIHFSAHVTTGKPWPVDGAPCPLGNVIILSAEDDAADTIRPRLDAAGADPARVVKVNAMRDIDENGKLVPRWISLKSDIERLDAVIAGEAGTKLLIIDPISAYSGGTDTHNNAETRVVLGQLAEMAARRRVAVVAITHLNKSSASAMYRTTGSLAFVAAARASFVVVKDQDDPERRLVLSIKTNLAKNIGGVAYRIEETIDYQPILVFEPDPVYDDPDEALTPDLDDKRAALEDATDWLADELSTGGVLTTDLQKAAGQAGHSWRTVQRAKAKLDVISIKDKFNGKWRWQLPPATARVPAAPAWQPSQNSTSEGCQEPTSHAGFSEGRQHGGAGLAAFGAEITCNDCRHWDCECLKGHAVRDCAHPRECPDFTATIDSGMLEAGE